MSKVIAPYIENAYSKGFAAGMSAVKDLLEGFVKQVVKAKNEEQDLEKKNK